jgi:methyltransferase (TIGR00027 family)
MERAVTGAGREGAGIIAPSRGVATAKRLLSCACTARTTKSPVDAKGSRVPEQETLIENVSDTAFWVAHYRAVESERPDALFHDPLAERLAGERGKKIAEHLPMPFMTGWILAIRTTIIDEFIQRAIAEGADTILNLGAGLDTRPYRMDLPAQLHWIEADYPAMIEFKEERLGGEKPRCNLERIKIDLSADAERREMLARIDAGSQKLLVLAEGVLPYLPAEQVGALADDLHMLDRIVYWIVEYQSPEVIKYRDRGGMQEKLRNAPFKFRPDDWFGFFAQHSWRQKETRYLSDQGDKLHRPIPFPPLAKVMIAVRTLFASKENREQFRRFSAYILLEPSR